MKIKMTYAIDEDDIHQEIGMLLMNSVTDFDKVRSLLINAAHTLQVAKEPNNLATVETLRTIISNTLKVIQKIDDMASILKDFDNYQIDKKKEAPKEVNK